MKIFEVFESPNEKSDNDPLANVADLDKDRIVDAAYWYILDHDNLHKQHFIPLALKIQKLGKENKLNREKLPKAFMPMVNSGCRMYHDENQLPGKFESTFPDKTLLAIAQRLADQACEDVLSGKYELDESCSIKGKHKKKKVTEVGASQMAGPSGPQYDTTGNNRLSEHDELAAITKLAGVGKLSSFEEQGSNVSITATEKARLMKEHNIKPGTDAWFKLWFSRPYMTNEKPIG